MLFLLVPGGFSYLKKQNNYNSNWKKLLEFRNLQEKLEKSLVLFSVFCYRKMVVIPSLLKKSHWKVSSLYDLQFFNCPDCDFKVQDKQTFVDHACDTHPTCIHYLTTIRDGSLTGVIGQYDPSFVAHYRTFYRAFLYAQNQ